MEFHDYIKSILPAFDWFTDERQLLAAAGYDAADALLEGLRDNLFPAVIVEDLPEGNFSFEAGFLDNRVYSLWVVEKVKATDLAAQREALRRCFERGKDILKRVVADGYTHPFAAGFDRSRTPYFPRAAVGQHCWGYEFLLTFHFDTDMTQ